MNNRIFHALYESASRGLEKASDWLMPKEEIVRHLEGLGPDGLFGELRPAENFDFETDKIKAIFDYKEPLCRRAIWEIKYRANRRLIRDFSRLLYDFILEDLPDLRAFHNFRQIVLLPVPSSRQRRREKGFNQTILIAKELLRLDQESGGNNFILKTEALTKTAETTRQSHVSNRRTRLKNLIGAFQANPANLLAGPGQAYIVIDDVITTGATMREAFRALKEAGVDPKKIRGYALAH